MAERHEIWQLIDAIESDIDAARAKLTELRAHVVPLNLPETSKVPCPICSLKFLGPRTLADHLYVSHSHTQPLGSRDEWALERAYAAVDSAVPGDEEQER